MNSLNAIHGGSIMTVQDLIEKLKCFDSDHLVMIHFEAQCGRLQYDTLIQAVEFKHGICVISSDDYS